MSRSVFAINISSFPFREARASAVLHLMARQASLLGRAERSPPEPGGSRRKARGVDGESARRATIVSGHITLHTYFAFLILPH